ncbi:MAG: DUF308 domain-containing protein [Methanomicrobiales archaeon]
MAESKNVVIGSLAILFGILIVAFPLIGVFTASIIDGTLCIVISLWLIMHSIQGFKDNTNNSLAFLILGIISLIIGLLIIGNIDLYSFFFGITFYIVGLILLIAGLLFIFMGEDKSTKILGYLGLISGILFNILGYYSMDPLVLALIIAAFLWIYGVYKILETG